MDSSGRVGERLWITDSVLSPHESQAVTEWHASQVFRNVSHSNEGVRALFDGPGHFASTLIWDAKEQTDARLDSTENLIVDAIRAEAGRAADLIGCEGIDWTRFTLTPWIHGVGSQLGWHTDKLEEGPERVGAYVWYVHPVWEFQWGGEFTLINSGLAAGIPAEKAGSWSQPDVVAHAPDPTMVLPRPNRLIIFPTDTYHCVRRIDVTAGDRVRRTLTGFFMADQVA